VTSVMRAQQVLLARVDAVLSPFGLTFARFEVLMLLQFSRSGALPLSRIGQRLQVHPASVTNAIDRLVPAAHRYLIGGFGIALADTLIVEWDGSGAFDVVCDLGDGSGMSHRPLYGAEHDLRPRSREAFIAATGAMRRAMLQRAETVGVGDWAGVEG